MGKFKSVFGKVGDPRASNRQHELLEVLFIAFAAILCGAEGAADMARFGHAKEGLLRRFLPLEHGIPSHDTFSRVFRLLEPVAFERQFHKFVRAFARFNRIKLKANVIAIDGKSLRGAYERGKSATPLHLVNAFAAQARLALASRKAPGRNEVAGALEVLQMLQLKDSIVTGDALFCARPIATLILERGGHYVLALKGNQSKLFKAVERRFAQSGPRSSTELLEPSTHGRREWRRATVIRDRTIGIEHNFPGIAALGRVTSRRRPHGGKAQLVIRYYLLSLPLSASRLLRTVRSRWSVENQLHWLLDVVLHEDADRARKDHAPENLAILRKLALNVLRAHPEKISMRQKVKSAAWDDTFLISLIDQFAHMR
jgi:predicted transposase YbfD/YdcC